MTQNLTAFTRLQKGVDTLISIHGTETTADLIESLSLEKNISSYTANINLQKLIVKTVVETFRINKNLLSTAPDPKYKQARQCCFYLLHCHCNMSGADIKKVFPKYLKTRNNINSQIKSMKEIIDLPRINKTLHDKWEISEKQITKFKTNS
jgi:chromosomal replication initiation ATPase DnaA